MAIQVFHCQGTGRAFIIVMQMNKVAVAVSSSTGKTCVLAPEQDWEIWLFQADGSGVRLLSRSRPPGSGIFPPGYAVPVFGLSGMPRFSNDGFSITDLLGLLDGAKIILALDFWPALIPQMGIYQIRCVKTHHQDPESAVKEFFGP